MEIQNLDRIGKTESRRKILNVLPEIFRKLDPENVSRYAGNELAKDLGAAQNVYVVGFGKAAFKMYRGLRSALADHTKKGWVLVPDDELVESDFPELEVLRGTHPITGKKSQDSTDEILDGLKDLKKTDTVIVLISGGGSALFESPVTGVTIDEIGDASKCLMAADADIYELNTFRRFFSKVKGGKFAERVFPARVVALIISDVFGDDLQTIASGPLTPWQPVISDLERLIEKYGKQCTMLAGLRKRADEHEVPQTVFDRVEHRVILRNKDFIREFEKIFDQWDVDHINLGANVNGDVRLVSESLSAVLNETRKMKPKGFWFVLGGETTVDVTGEGRGGRNQELALRIMQHVSKEDFLFLSIGTDGIDGKSPAMGAIVDPWLRERVKNDEINKYLKDSDSFELLDKYDSAIITGRTGNNVSDIMLGYYSGG